MQTIDKLQAGKLAGTTKLKISAGLKEFPNEILDLFETLEYLDLSGNQLLSLPDDFDKLKKLKILFLSDNKFQEIPSILSRCKSLEMIGFKANEIEYFPEDSIPLNTRWLILTDNKLREIPRSIGKCKRLQKFMLAGNQLKDLPVEMAGCHNLELLRISANQLEALPEWLFHLPRLSWLAFAGNKFTDKKPILYNPIWISWSELEILEKLGEGASGVIYKALWNKSNTSDPIYVAVKIFKGEVTSDGLPSDEMDACIASGIHSNLVSVLGRVEGHPEKKQGLVLGLISPLYKNLGGPPSLISCTRDTFDEATSFKLSQVISIAKGIASAAAQLHKNGINHGDLYAHNILVDSEGHPLFGDFGAATFYNFTSINTNLLVQLIEVRAFGCLLDDLVGYLAEENDRNMQISLLYKLRDECLIESVIDRPTFDEILLKIIDIENQVFD